MEKLDTENIKNTDYAKIDSILNRKDGQLPFGYFHGPSEGKITWNCGIDQNGKITSVFCNDMGTHKDKKISYLANFEEAKKYRDILIADGWLPIKPPEITMKYADGSNKPLNREQKRQLAKKLKELEKTTPFDDENT